MSPKISAVILTHNNATTIRRCLQSLAWCDEIVIIDDGSTDETLRIASSMKARIFHRALNGDFAAQRNFGLSMATHEWIFFVDADEVVSKELQIEISYALPVFGFDAYRIPRTTIINQKTMRFGEFLRFAVIRLAKKTAGSWQGKIHETWHINGSVGAFSSSLLHTQEGGVQRSLQKINTYSSIRASELYAHGIRSSFFKILFFPLGKFALNYIVRLGLLDGTAGIVNAFTMSFYTFLVRGKLWFLWHENQKA